MFRALHGVSHVVALTLTVTLLGGCRPERPLEAVRPSQSNASKGDSTSSVPPASGSANKPAPATAKGPIAVDKDGFVTLATSGTDAAAPAALAAGGDSTTKGLPKSLTDQTRAALAVDSTPSSAVNSSLTVDSGRANKATQGQTDNPESLAAGRSPGGDAAPAELDEKNQSIARDWPKPQAVLFITGQQHGYIEPCGCTGLENQKGGLNRRDTLLSQLRDRGWDIVPLDVGNFERRTGVQAELKLQTTIKALNYMQYRAATLGVDDLKLSSTHLMALTASEGKTQTPFISANTYILVEEFMPKWRVIEAGGRKIGVTAVLGDSFAAELKSSSDVVIQPAADALRKALEQLQAQGCDYLVLLSHAKLAESRQLAIDVPGFDLVVSAGDFPEPDYNLEAIEGSRTKLIQVGAKGMFTTLVGLYPNEDKPVRYQRVALSSQFVDSPRMMELFASYQKQLQDKGFEGLKVPVQALPDDLKFVGSESCGDCHSRAFEVWKDSGHFGATESLVHPPNSRSMIPRHFDPECLSCHVTGWNPQRYYPYSSGFASLEQTPKLTGNGCENCHGPGSAHVAAESADVDASQETLIALRNKMRLPLAEAKDRCLQCHDQDNSPDFQHEGAFEEYWQQIAHPFKD